MINTTPITQYTQLLRAAELAQQKEVKMSIQQARLLNLALTELLEKVNRDYESMYNGLKSSVSESAVSVSMDGGGFDQNQ